MKLNPLLLCVACAMSFNERLASGTTEDTSMQATCRLDSDCKLIYSSCICMAVGIGDPRDTLDNDHGIACHHNACRAEHARAGCDGGNCKALLPPGSTFQLPQANGVPSGR